MPSPANYTVVTKSGTNELHGTALYNYNGNRLNARNFFDASTPFRVYNNLGASIGGPGEIIQIEVVRTPSQATFTVTPTENLKPGEEYLLDLGPGAPGYDFGILPQKSMRE